MQRFYGGDPERWLHLPEWLFWVYSKMQPRLAAEEAMETITQLQAGAGLLSQDQYKKYTGELQRRAYPGEERRGARPRTMRELQSIPGIVVEGGE